jgi:hypothetical protein
MVVAMLVMGELRLPGCHTCEARNIGPTKVPNNEARLASSVQKMTSHATKESTFFTRNVCSLNMTQISRNCSYLLSVPKQSNNQAPRPRRPRTPSLQRRSPF